MAVLKEIMRLNKMEHSDQKNFYQILCNYSINKDPKLAILEWDYIYSTINKNKCICGQPIKDNCIIKNMKNGNELIVGNVCINKFLNKNYDFIFKGIQACKEKRSPNKSFINYCFENNYIVEYEYNFLMDLFRKRRLTLKQERFKISLLFKLATRKKW